MQYKLLYNDKELKCSNNIYEVIEMISNNNHRINIGMSGKHFIEPISMEIMNNNSLNILKDYDILFNKRFILLRNKKINNKIIEQQYTIRITKYNQIAYKKNIVNIYLCNVENYEENKKEGIINEI